MLQAEESRLFFVGGAFGTGKSTLCKTLGRMLPARHLKASDLIGYVAEPDDTTGKAVPQVLNNQERLIAALATCGDCGGMTLLDGHFCLIDASHNVVKLPVSVFQRINPSALIVVESNPLQIAARIEQRDGKGIDHSLIERLAQAERDHAEAVGEALNIPIKFIDSSTAIDEVVGFLRSISAGS